MKITLSVNGVVRRTLPDATDMIRTCDELLEWLDPDEFWPRRPEKLKSAVVTIGERRWDLGDAMDAALRGGEDGNQWEALLDAMFDEIQADLPELMGEEGE